MQRNMLRWLGSAALAFAPVAFAQDAGTAAWLEKEGLEAASTKSLNEFDAVIARPKGGGDERALVFAKGKPAWQSNPKETEPGAKWAINSIGRDLNGDGQPDVHFSTNTGGANCCVTHHIYELKPLYNAKNDKQDKGDKGAKGQNGAKGATAEPTTTPGVRTRRPRRRPRRIKAPPTGNGPRWWPPGWR